VIDDAMRVLTPSTVPQAASDAQAAAARMMRKPWVCCRDMEGSGGDMIKPL
jgi:hypothetical protein